MENILPIVLVIVAIAGLLAFTGAIKAATVIARFVFYIGLVVFVGLVIAALIS